MPGENYCEAVAVGSGKVPNFDALKRPNMATGLPATTGGQMPTPPPPAPRPSGRGGTYAINPFRRRRPRSGGGRNMRRQQPATTTPTDVYQHAQGSTWIPANRTASTASKTAPVSGGSSVPSRTTPPSHPPAHINHSKNGGTGTPRRNPVVGVFQATISVPKKVIGFLVIKPVTFVVGGSTR